MRLGSPQVRLQIRGPARVRGDRDAVRAPEAHPEARSASTARPTGRTRRIHARRHRPEPETARNAGRSATTRPGSVHRVALELRKERQGQRIKAAGP